MGPLSAPFSASPAIGLVPCADNRTAESEEEKDYSGQFICSAVSCATYCDICAAV